MLMLLLLLFFLKKVFPLTYAGAYAAVPEVVVPLPPGHPPRDWRQRLRTKLHVGGDALSRATALGGGQKRGCTT